MKYLTYVFSIFKIISRVYFPSLPIHSKMININTSIIVIILEDIPQSIEGGVNNDNEKISEI